VPYHSFTTTLILSKSNFKNSDAKAVNKDHLHHAVHWQAGKVELLITISVTKYCFSNSEKWGMPNKYYSITGKNRLVRRKVLSGNSQLIIFLKQ